MVTLTAEQTQILERFRIPYRGLARGDLLIEIDWAMTNCLDEKDEPTEDFRILRRLYDAIYNAE